MLKKKKKPGRSSFLRKKGFLKKKEGGVMERVGKMPQVVRRALKQTTTNQRGRRRKLGGKKGPREGVRETKPSHFIPIVSETGFFTKRNCKALVHNRHRDRKTSSR